MDVVAGVLESPFKSGAFDISVLENSSSLAQVCRLCYHIVFHFSRVRIAVDYLMLCLS